MKLEEALRWYQGCFSPWPKHKAFDLNTTIPRGSLTWNGTSCKNTNIHNKVFLTWVWKIPTASNISALILQRQTNTFVFQIFPGPPYRHILANSNKCEGSVIEKGYQRVRDNEQTERVNTPFAVVYSWSCEDELVVETFCSRSVRPLVYLLSNDSAYTLAQ